MLLSDADFRRDIDRFLELFEQAFGRRSTAEFFIWRYGNKTIDGLLPINVSVDDEKFVANYSANPVVLTRHGADLRFLMSMTTMTHPRYEGRGLSAKLGNELYKWASGKGIAGVIGFPNHSIHHIRRVKLAWEDIYEIPTFSLRLSPDSNVKAGGIAPSIDIQGEVDMPDWINDFWHIKRTADYLRWRYVENPVNDYQFWVPGAGAPVRSYCVTKRFRDQMDLVDFVPETRNSAELLLRSVISYCASRGISQINAWVQPHVFFRGAFERTGFTNQAPVTYFGGRLFGDTAPGSADAAPQFLEYKSWFIQMGDSDVY